MNAGYSLELVADEIGNVKGIQVQFTVGPMGQGIVLPIESAKELVSQMGELIEKVESGATNIIIPNNNHLRKDQ